MRTTGTTIVDGGLSTALEEQGARLGRVLWTADLLAREPERIVAAHLAFLRAGARVLITSSYQASRAGFAAAGLGADADRLLAATTRLAREAVDRYAAEDALAAGAVRVGASVGPYGAVLADGSEYTGRYPLGHDELVAFHAERLEALVATRPDLLVCETLPGPAEAAAIAAAMPTGAPPAWVSFTCADGARTRTGDGIEAAVTAALTVPGVEAVGVNCTAPEHVAELLRRMATVTGLPLVAYPNAGQRWDGTGGRWDGPADDVAEPERVAAWVAAGARYVGGCCGVGPDGIARLAAVLAPG